jgi:hypothetical protein
MPKWLRTLALPLAVLALVAASCADDETTSASDTGTSTEEGGRRRAGRRILRSALVAVKRAVCPDASDSGMPLS